MKVEKGHKLQCEPNRAHTNQARSDLNGGNSRKPRHNIQLGTKQIRGCLKRPTALPTGRSETKRRVRFSSATPDQPQAGQHAGPQLSRLEDDLINILQAGALAKHIDPPVSELEDEHSRLKTQCLQLATQVLHLQNQSEAKRVKQRPKYLQKLEGRQVEYSPSSGTRTTPVNLPSAQSRVDLAGSGILRVFDSSINPRSRTTRSDNVRSSANDRKTPSSVAPRRASTDIQMTSPPSTQPTPILDQLLDEIQAAVQGRDGERIASVLQIEPPLGQAYVEVSKELQTQYPAGKDQQLRTTCQRVLPKIPESSKHAWESFGAHLVGYLQFLRDYSSDHNLLKTNNDVKQLLNASVICLGDTTFGVVILPNVIYLGKLLAKFSVGLDKKPELVAQLWHDYAVDQNRDVKAKITFVEDAANTLREAFIKCLSDRSGAGGQGRYAAPHGKRAGIYKVGNLCLKLLLQCGKLSSATTMFVSIDAQSPLLSHYQTSQRVTYLYYLGRYLFANNHFYRAQLALQAAYDQCHAHALSNRRLILVYLIASNVCLGRFPSSKLLVRRESAELAKHYLPLCRLIASGNLAGFREYLSLDNPHGQWFLRKRLLLQLRNRCELLVWRSLARRVFIQVGYPGGEDNKTPFLRLTLLQAAAQLLNRNSNRPGSRSTDAIPQNAWASSLGDPDLPVNTDMGKEDSEVVDLEFAGMEDAIAETGFNIETGTYQEIGEHGKAGARAKSLNVHRHLVDPQPSIEEVECVMASLIQQDLVCGFLTHSNPRFAIPGAKTRGALAVGFPNIWGVIRARKDGDEVPGWVKQEKQRNDHAIAAGRPLGGDGGGGGRVVNLSGAKPVGAGVR